MRKSDLIREAVASIEKSQRHTKAAGRLLD